MNKKKKCIPPRVAIVEMNAKCHSSQRKTALFTAGNVFKIIGLPQNRVEADLENPEADAMTDHVKCMM